MINKKVLVLGTSFSALPIIEYLLAKNFYVGTVGSLPDEAGHTISDKQHCVNYGDVEAVSDIFRTGEYSYIVPSCNDTSYETVAQITDLENLIQNDNTEIAKYFLKKNLFKQLCEKNSIPVPKKYGSINEIKFNKVKKVIVKSDDQSSGIGMSICSTPETLEQAIEDARKKSKSKEIIIEDFIDGPLISFTTFRRGGVTYYSTSCNEYCDVTGFQVSSSIWPSNITDDIKSIIKIYIDKLLDFLQIHNGMSHFQIIIQNGIPYFLEAMRRCPGDLFPRGVYLSENFDFYGNYVSQFVNYSDKNERSPLSKAGYNHVIREIYYPKEKILNKGVVSKNSFEEFYPLSVIGSIVPAAPYGKIGISFSRNDVKKNVTQKSDWFKKSGYTNEI